MRWRVRRLTTPPTVLPEVLLGIAANHRLEFLREREHKCIGVGFAIAGARCFDCLETQHVTPARLAY